MIAAQLRLEMHEMDDIELSPAEWEWFKQLARSSAASRAAPIEVRRKLVTLKLIEEKRGGDLGPTLHGRDVLKLVDARWRGGWRWREPRRV